MLKEDGERVTSFTIAGTKGLNQFRWDLVLKTNVSPQPNFINYKEYLNPGKYRLQIDAVDKQTMEQVFTVVDAPYSD